MIEQVLDDCIEDIRKGRATIRECLTKYPEYAAELEPLLETAVALQNAPDVRPSAAFKAKTRTQFLETKRPRPTRPFWNWQPRFSLVNVAALLLFLILTTGLAAYASNDSLPGTPLYPIKRSVEQVQLWLTPDPENQARAIMGFADRRVSETKALAANPDAENLIEQTIEEYNAEVSAAASKVPASSKPNLTNELTNQVNRQQDNIKSLEKKVPDKALEKALDASQKAKDNLKKK